MDNEDVALKEHKIGLGELHESLSLIWGSLSLVWADIFLTCFSLSKNSSKTLFFPKIELSIKSYRVFKVFSLNLS